MGGLTHPDSRKLSNLRMQLSSGKTRGQNSRELRAEEIAELEMRRDAIVARMQTRAVERVNSHTTHEITRAIGEVNAHTTGAMKLALREELCPGVTSDATPQEEIAALRARQGVTQTRLGVLREMVAKRRKEEMEDRSTRKLVERAAAKEDRASAKKTEKAAAKEEKDEDDDMVPLVAPKLAAKRAARAPKAKAAPACPSDGQLCGHLSKAGVVCKRLAPCSSHNKKAHAEAKKMREAAAADAAVVEAAIEPAAEEAAADAAVVEAAIEPAAEEVVVAAAEVVMDAVACDAEEDDGMAAFLATLPP